MSQLRQLGKVGPKVTPLGLGCMGMSPVYGEVRETESIATIQRAIDLGVTLIDTADMYGWGQNETLVGKAIKGQREKIILSTKMGFVQKGEGFAIDTSPNYIKSACDASLKRLDIDVIDIYYLHRVAKTTPIEDSMLALVDLIKAGKIRYIGLSEVTSETLRRAAKIHPITAVQTEYSLWQRDPETKILPTCRELGVGFVPYSPLGRGFLTGAYDNSEAFHANDFRRVLARFQQDNLEENKKLLSNLRTLASTKNCTLAQLALAWLLAQDKSIVAIPGTKKIKYLEENMGALQMQLSKGEINTLDVLFPLNIAKGEQYPAHLNFEN